MNLPTFLTRLLPQPIKLIFLREMSSVDSNENRDIKSHIMVALSFPEDTANFVKPEKERFVSRL
jgi:hypothetical protein